MNNCYIIQTVTVADRYVLSNVCATADSDYEWDE